MRHYVSGVDKGRNNVKCISLKSIVIPDSVTEIGNLTFSDCWSLQSIEIPSSVKTIEAEAFSGCTSLKSIMIPSGITCIKEWTFCDCTSLESVVIPDNVTKIRGCAFMGYTDSPRNSYRLLVRSRFFFAVFRKKAFKRCRVCGLSQCLSSDLSICERGYLYCMIILLQKFVLSMIICIFVATESAKLPI